MSLRQEKNFNLIVLEVGHWAKILSGEKSISLPFPPSKGKLTSWLVTVPWMLAEHRRPVTKDYFLQQWQQLEYQHFVWFTEPRFPWGRVRRAPWHLHTQWGVWQQRIPELGELKSFQLGSKHACSLLPRQVLLYLPKLKSSSKSNKHENSGFNLQTTFHIHHLI